MGVSLSKGYRRQTAAVGTATKGCASHFAPDGKHCHPVPMATHTLPIRVCAVRCSGWIWPDLDGLRSTAIPVLIIIYPHRGILIVAVRQPWCAIASESEITSTPRAFDYVVCMWRTRGVIHTEVISDIQVIDDKLFCLEGDLNSSTCPRCFPVISVDICPG